MEFSKINEIAFSYIYIYIYIYKILFNLYSIFKWDEAIGIILSKNFYKKV